MINKQVRPYLFLLFLLLLNSLEAQDIFITADEIVTILAEGREETELKGNVRIERESKIILAHSALIQGKDNDFITFTGNIRLKDAENEFTLQADELQFDTVKNELLGRGNIIMVDQKNELSIQAKYLFYNEDEEKIILQNGIQIVQDDLSVTSEYAIYWKDLQKLELSGLPRVEQKQNIFESFFISVDLDTDEITMQGKITGSLISDGKDDPPPADEGEIAPLDNGESAPLDSATENSGDQTNPEISTTEDTPPLDVGSEDSVNLANESEPEQIINNNLESESTESE